MIASDIDKTAAALVDARRRGAQIAPPHGAPSSEDEVYAIQDSVARLLGGGIDGWKTGAPAPDATPNCAPILGGCVLEAPLRFDPTGMHMVGFEAEVAFRFGRDLPASTTAPTQAQVLDAIASAHVVLEIVDTRVADFAKADPLWKLADNGMNRALAVGDEFRGWREIDHVGQPVTVRVDGKTTVEKKGGNSGGSPIRLVTWLAQHVVTRRGGLRAGQVVTTGSWIGLPFTQPGATVEATFAGLGSVRVEFKA